MGQFVVDGGRRLEGAFRVNGAKNAALPLLAAAVLAHGPVYLDNIPLQLHDVRLMRDILRVLGARIREAGGSRLVVDASSPLDPVIPEDLMTRMRASLFLAGPLAARTGEVVLAYPGGCDIGQRPIDLHLKGLAALGVDFREEAGGRIHGRVERLKGTRVFLDYPSVGATENILMAAVAAEGETQIVNAAQEPEVVDLAQLLIKMGAHIGGAGTAVIRVEGTGGRPLSGASHTIIPDRIEAGTMAIAAAITGGRVELGDCMPDHLQALWQKLSEMGVIVDYEPGGDWAVIEAPTGPLFPIQLQTGPYPRFPTDLQPQMMALMTAARGGSMVRETVFDNRLRHVSGLVRMRAHVQVAGNVAWVEGPTRLAGATVQATDLRAGAALVVAGLAAEGETTVEGAEAIERGYAEWPERLSGLGARIARREADGSGSSQETAGSIHR